MMIQKHNYDDNAHVKLLNFTILCQLYTLYSGE